MITPPKIWYKYTAFYHFIIGIDIRQAEFTGVFTGVFNRAGAY